MECAGKLTLGEDLINAKKKSHSSEVDRTRSTCQTTARIQLKVFSYKITSFLHRRLVTGKLEGLSVYRFLQALAVYQTANLNFHRIDISSESGNSRFRCWKLVGALSWQAPGDRDVWLGTIVGKGFVGHRLAD